MTDTIANTNISTNTNASTTNGRSETETSTIILLFLSAAIILIFVFFRKYFESSDSNGDSEGKDDVDENDDYREGFKNYGNYTNYSIKNHEQRIADTNNRRNNEGRFYVNCHACGRERVMQELYGKDTRPKKNNDSQNKYCIDDCGFRSNNTMSFYNNNYVDSDNIFCYNCLLDNYFPPDNVTMTPFAKNHIYWPSLEDPNNGVPYS